MIDVVINTYGEKCHAKESRKEINFEILCVEMQQMWKLKLLILPVGISRRNSNRRFKEKFGSHVRRTFDRYISKDSCIWSSTQRHTESAAD
jgi:AraC-like DNA-binding protein